MSIELKTIEELVSLDEELVEVELMLTPEELRDFATYCIKKDIKFNDWIRKVAHESLEKEI